MLLLGQESSRSITIEALASQCGFASQTTFNRAFKNSLGVTPTQYLKLKS
jgi:AraC-like DNA-binding protein